MSVELTGVLEIDEARGVIYFHADKTSMKNGAAPTVLRICQLPKPIPFPYELLDVTMGVGCNWKEEEKKDNSDSPTCIRCGKVIGTSVWYCSQCDRVFCSVCYKKQEKSRNTCTTCQREKGCWAP